VWAVASPLPARRSSQPDDAGTAPRLTKVRDVSEAEIAAPPSFSRLDVGIMIVLVSMAGAGLIGLIAVFDADSDIGAAATGFGIALLIFETGATAACALACLVRGRLEALSLGALVAAGLAVDLFALAIWLEIHSEAYGKVTGVAFVLALFGLIILGLSLAVHPRDAPARWLYLGAVGASLLAGVLATVLIVDADGNGVGFYSSGPVPIAPFGNESVLRPLGAALVVLAALWFAALAASRVSRQTADGGS
jgi:hypothetical protein